jgi:nucleoside-diphosphate-sugar epimerase
MKILVIGGTGFFGKQIVELALEAGHQVSVFSRGNQQPAFWDQITPIVGDRTDPEDFANKLKGKQFDAVIDNIAFDGTTVSQALNVFEGNIGHYIFTSSIAVYMGSGTFDHPLREDHLRSEPSEDLQLTTFPTPTPAGLVGYANGKIAAEKVIMNYGKIPYTILRPPAVVGPEDPDMRDHFYYQRMLDSGPLMLTNGAIQTRQPVHSVDLARSYLQALDNPAAMNQAYTIAQDGSFRVVDWLSFIASCLGVEPNFINIPAEVFAQTGFIYSEPYVWTGTFSFDVSKAIKDLGFQPTPIATWTRETIDWYKTSSSYGDSDGYADRAKEIEFANGFLEKITELKKGL